MWALDWCVRANMFTHEDIVVKEEEIDVADKDGFGVVDVKVEDPNDDWLPSCLYRACV